MGLSMLIVVPLGVLCFMSMFSGYNEKFQRTVTSTKVLNDTAVEYIGGIEVIKAFGQSGMRKVRLRRKGGRGLLHRLDAREPVRAGRFLSLRTGCPPSRTPTRSSSSTAARSSSRARTTSWSPSTASTAVSSSSADRPQAGRCKPRDTAISEFYIKISRPLSCSRRIRGGHFRENIGGASQNTAALAFLPPFCYHAL